MSKHFTVNRIAILSILIALCHIGRLAFQFIPNVQPVTTILIIIALTLGTIDGVVVASMSILISNMLLGMGPWTIYQIITYAAIMLITGSLKPVYEGLSDHTKVRGLVFALYAGVAGMMYGFIISIFSANMFGIQNFWVYYIQGVSFDLMHAVGNVAFFLVLEPILDPIIQKRLRGYTLC